MYFHKQESSMEDTLEKAGGEETMSDKLKVNMNEYLPLRDVVFNTLRQAIITRRICTRRASDGDRTCESIRSQQNTCP